MRFSYLALAAALVLALAPLGGAAPAGAQHRQYQFRPGPEGVQRVPFIAPAARRPFGRTAPRDGLDPLWLMDVINNLSNLTVLGMRPSTPGKFAVVDFYPKGEVLTSGQSMAHWCDRDLDEPNTGLACGQFLTTRTDVRIGVITGGDAPEFPVKIVGGGTTNQNLGIFRRNVSTLAPELIVGAWSSTTALAEMRATRALLRDLSRRLEASEARVRDLERAARK